MYSLVEFLKEQSTAPVAKEWLDGAFAWWPPYHCKKALLRSIKAREAPQPEKGWARHEVRVLYESGNLKNKIQFVEHMKSKSISIIY